MEYISNNYEWIFSGIGVVAIGLLINLLRKKEKNIPIIQKQKTGDNSTNVQIGQINNDQNG